MTFEAAPTGIAAFCSPLRSWVALHLRACRPGMQRRGAPAGIYVLSKSSVVRMLNV